MTKIVFMFFLFLTTQVHASERSVTWSATYFNAMPNKPGITNEYCKAHTPGTFVGNVNDQLRSGAKTDKGIYLDQFTFHAAQKYGMCLMNGTLRARGKFHGKFWEDRIRYYVYKLTEYGITRGVWSSGKCKGYFLGKAVP